MLKQLAIGLVGLGLATSTAEGSVLWYQNFDYGQTLTDGAAINGTDGWTGENVTNIGTGVWKSSGLQYTDSLGNTLDTSGGHAYGRIRKNTPYVDGSVPTNHSNYVPTVWISMIAQQSPFGASNQERSILFQRTTSSGDMMKIGGSGTSSNWFLVDTQSAATASDTGVNRVDSTSLLLLKGDLTTGTWKIWVNPVLSSADEAALGTPDGSFTNATNANRINRFYSLIGTNNGMSVDEIRMTTTMAEAMPHTVVPEPTAVALLGLGAAGLLRRRRSA